MHQSRNNVARASGVSVNDRQANAARLRAKLAYHQAKFLLTNGNDQVRSVHATGSRKRRYGVIAD